MKLPAMPVEFLAAVFVLAGPARADCFHSNADCVLAKTEAGDLEIKGKAGEMQAIVLNGKQLHEEDVGDITIRSTFPEKGPAHLALIELNTGGTGCPANFRVVYAPKEPGKALISEEFGNCSDLPEVKYEKGTLTVALPKGGGKKDSWTFTGGKLKGGPAKAK